MIGNKEDLERKEEMSVKEEIADTKEMDTVKPDMPPVDEDKILESLESGTGIPEVEIVEEPEPVVPADVVLDDKDPADRDNKGEDAVVDKEKERKIKEPSDLDKQEASVGTEQTEIEKLQAELEKQRRDALAARGSASAAMRELNAIKQQISAGDVAGAEKRIRLTEKEGGLKELMDDYGVNLQPIEEILSDVPQSVQAISEELAQARAQLATVQAKQQLVEKHPDYYAVINNDDFTTWVRDTLAPEEIQQADTDPAFASAVISAYKDRTRPMEKKQPPKTERERKRDKAGLGLSSSSPARKIPDVSDGGYIDEDAILKEIESRVI